MRMRVCLICSLVGDAARRCGHAAGLLQFVNDCRLLVVKTLILSSHVVHVHLSGVDGGSVPPACFLEFASQALVSRLWAPFSTLLQVECGGFAADSTVRTAVHLVIYTVGPERFSLEKRPGRCAFPTNLVAC